jgi:3,4-dihydroxy 2-butanone 4-phosphate synthase
MGGIRMTPCARNVVHCVPSGVFAVLADHPLKRPSMEIHARSVSMLTLTKSTSFPDSPASLAPSDADTRPLAERIAQALDAMRDGRPVVLLDDDDRENEADLILAAERLTNSNMAMMIRECSGIVCLCLTPEKVRQLGLRPMVENNRSQYGTAFTVSIEAREGVTTGVSAADRITTIRAAIADEAGLDAVVSPGHVFPLVAVEGACWRVAGIPRARLSSRAWRACRRPRCCAS